MKVHTVGSGRTVTRVVLAVAIPLLGLSSSLLASPVASAAPAPQLSATPTALDFGDVVITTTSTAQQVKVTNVGTAAVTLTGTYGSSGPFTTTGNCIGTTVPKNGTCQLTVTFAPTNPGPASATLVNTFNGVKVNVGVHGNGYAKFRISPLTLDFADVAVGDTSPQQLVTITNVTSAPIHMSGSTENIAPFVRQTGCQGIDLDPGNSCSMAYTYDPTSVGTSSLTDSGNWSGEQYAVALKGNAVSHLLITPTGLDFGAVLLHTKAAQQVVTVTNTGTSTLTMNGMQSGGVGVGFSQDCQGIQLAAGDSCHMNFGFVPTRTTASTATMTGSWNGQGYSISLAGSGRTKARPANPFRVSPTSIDFGSAPLAGAFAAHDVTVTNQTASPITPNITFTEAGPFSVNNGACSGVTLEPGGSCALQLVFDPGSIGAITGSVTTTLNGQQVVISLTGRGRAEFLVTPLALEFSPTHLNGLVSDATVSVTNEANNPVVVSGRNLGAGPFGGTLQCPGGSTILAAGASCTITYGFLPHAAGRVTATANGFLTNQAVSISMGGLGLADLAISPAGLAFVPQAVGTKSPAQAVSVHNVSGQPLSLNITNNPAPANFLVTDSCGASLAIGASCSYSVIFKPTSTGTKTGTFKATIAKQSPQVALTGKGK